jgi:chemotaxis-related protein WspB
MADSHARAAAARRLYLLFCIGPDRYALEARDVAEVLGLRALKQVPGAPSWVAGMLERRGAAVPVIDMSALAGRGGGGGRDQHAAGAGALPRRAASRAAAAGADP